MSVCVCVLCITCHTQYNAVFQQFLIFHNLTVIFLYYILFSVTYAPVAWLF